MNKKDSKATFLNVTTHRVINITPRPEWADKPIVYENCTLTTSQEEDDAQVIPQGHQD